MDHYTAGNSQAAVHRSHPIVEKPTKGIASWCDNANNIKDLASSSIKRGEDGDAAGR